MVKAWSVDRLGRSLQGLVGFLSDFHAYGIDLFLQQQGLDTTTGDSLCDKLGDTIWCGGTAAAPWRRRALWHGTVARSPPSVSRIVARRRRPISRG
jgi:hypothetical protein